MPGTIISIQQITHLANRPGIFKLLNAVTDVFVVDDFSSLYSDVEVIFSVAISKHAFMLINDEKINKKYFLYLKIKLIEIII